MPPRRNKSDPEPVKKYGTRERVDLNRLLEDTAHPSIRNAAITDDNRDHAEPEVIPNDDPWAVDDQQFPRHQGLEAKLRFCARYALLAHSSHNSQPWRFRIETDHLDLLADRARALPVLDPDDRQLTIACGAALFNLRIAMRCLGMVERCALLPDPTDPDLLARISTGHEREEPTPEVTQLFHAIRTRRTNRGRFDDDDLPALLLKQLTDAASAEDASLHIVDAPDGRLALADLIAEADIVQLSDRKFRRELAAWLHHNRTHSHDGIPGYALGMNELESLVSPLVIRTFDLGKGRAARDEQIALHSPTLAVISTPNDHTTDWINAGQALARVLLRACASGVSASFLNQPVEVPHLRPRVRQIMPAIDSPQIILRMGYGGHVRRTPRRSIDEVVLR